LATIKPIFTYDDLAQMPDDGKRYEILEGELVVSPSPVTKHQWVVGNLFAFLRRAYAAGYGLVFDAPLDVVGLVRIEAVASRKAQPALDVVGFGAQAVGAAVADAVAAVEQVDLALDRVDPDLERPDLAVIVVVAVAVAVAVGLLLREILGRGRCRTLEGHTRLYVSAQDYYLPDVWVTCADRPAPGQPQATPTLNAASTTSGTVISQGDSWACS